MTDQRKRVVESGYDSMAEGYLKWAGVIEDAARDRFLSEFSKRLPNGAHVLDLGCGAGEPSTRILAERFAVVGVDISEAQLELARERVPGAKFVHGDMTDVIFPEAAFAGITAFYSISHIPREDHGELFRQIAVWLEPGGFLLATLGAIGIPDWTGEWLGVPMFFSSHDAETNRELLRAAGFELLLDEIVESREPEGPVKFLWILAHKSALLVSIIG